MTQLLTEAELQAGIRFEVRGDPYPWCVFTRRGVPSLQFQHMQAWQWQIQAAAKEAMGDRLLLTGAVRLDVLFYDPKAHRHDLDNLRKAFSDALQGIVYKNDAQVAIGESAKLTDTVGLSVALVRPADLDRVYETLA